MVEESKAVAYNLPCTNHECRSSDALALYSDGHSHCFSCGQHIRYNKEYMENLEHLIKEERKELKGPSSGLVKDITSRKISKDTCAFYGVETLVDTEGKPTGYSFPYYYEGKRVAQKIKNGKKAPLPYTWNYQEDVKPSNMSLFGQNLFPAGSSRYITITEGELDALAAFQMSGSKYPVLSIKNGAQAAVKDLRPHLEYLESFDNIYICFDNDEPGKTAAAKVVDLFSPGKAKVVSLRKYKDACDYLKNDDSRLFIEEWWKAEVYTPEGLVLSSTLKDKIRNKKNVVSYSYPWKKMNEMTFGIREGELIVFTAPPKVGKTQVLREMAYHLLMTYPDLKLGGLFIEETPEISAEGLMALHMNKRIHLPNVVFSQKEWEEAFEAVLSTDRLVYFDAFGCNDVDSIIKRIRWMNKSYGCQVVILDHISMLAADHKSDERKTLDYAALELKKLTMETGLTIIIVAHENRNGQIHGTSSIEKLANLVVEMDRDRINENELIRNTLTLLISFNRHSGDSGPAGHLFFNKETGRLVELENPEEYYDLVRKQGEDFDGEEDA